MTQWHLSLSGTLYTAHICLYCLINLFTMSYFPLNMAGAVFAPRRGIMSGVRVVDVLVVAVGFGTW